MSKAKPKKSKTRTEKTHEVLIRCRHHVEVVARDGNDESRKLQTEIETLLGAEKELSAGFATALSSSHPVALTVQSKGNELSWEDSARVIQLFVEKGGEIHGSDITVASATLRPALTSDSEAWLTQSMSSAVQARMPKQGRVETTSPHSIEDLTAMLRECSLASHPQILDALAGAELPTPKEAIERLSALRQQRLAESEATLPVYQKMLDSLAGELTDSLATNEERVQLVNSVRSDYGFGIRLREPEDQPRVTLTLDRTRPNGGRFMAKSTAKGRATRYTGRKFPDLIAEVASRHTPENLPRTADK